jgi:hypothetical protein
MTKNPTSQNCNKPPGEQKDFSEIMNSISLLGNCPSHDETAASAHALAFPESRIVANLK